MLMELQYRDMAKQAKKVKPPKATRTQITITVNTHFLDRLEAIGGQIGRNRSEMIVSIGRIRLVRRSRSLAVLRWHFTNADAPQTTDPQGEFEQPAQPQMGRCVVVCRL